MAKPAELRIILADDHALVRQGIRTLVEKIKGVTVVGEADNGLQVLDLTRELGPDIVIMDIGMPELNGLEATLRLKQEFKDIQVIMLSMYASDEFVLQALRAGAMGYLLKNARAQELEEAVRTVAEGSMYLTPAVSGSVAEYMRNPKSENPLDKLTTRQREILQLIAEGYSTKNIAGKLFISEKTVETHRSRLMDNLGIFDIAGLVRFAIRNHLITPED
jgi:DNA-binding NarL/FixJ family response regulator